MLCGIPPRAAAPSRARGNESAPRGVVPRVRFPTLAVPALLGALALLAAPRTAGATTGGPETLEVLGAETRDGKVYFLRHFHDEGDRLPQLEYFLLDGPQAGHTVRVRSWYADADGGVARFEPRLAALKKRLAPLSALRTSEVSLTERVIRKGEAPQRAPDPPRPVETREVTAITPRATGRQTIVVDAGRPAEIADARAVSPDRAVAIVRYRGLFVEIGYDTETAVLLRAPAAGRPAAP
jgi:hypothetical protein